jgi:hypothetical protein
MGLMKTLAGIPGSTISPFANYSRFGSAHSTDSQGIAGSNQFIEPLAGKRGRENSIENMGKSLFITYGDEMIAPVRQITLQLLGYKHKSYLINGKRLRL